jgi:hypothetical protein
MVNRGGASILQIRHLILNWQLSIISLFLAVVVFSPQLKADSLRCSVFFTVRQPSAIQMVLSNYEFPAYAEFYLSEPILRIAIHEAFEGRDIYTGLPLAYNEMSIDHIVPRSKQGVFDKSGQTLDNIFNYAPTTQEINNAKGSKFEHEHLQILEMVKNVYAPRVISLLELYGAFENRSAELIQAREAFTRRKKNRIKIRSVGQLSPHNAIESRPGIIFRRQVSGVEEELVHVLLAFAGRLSQFSERRLASILEKREILLDLPIGPDSIESYIHRDAVNLRLTYRKNGRKLDEEVLALHKTLFKVIQVESGSSHASSRAKVYFHPFLALKLLDLIKSDDSVDLANLLDELFITKDISRQEFADWMNLSELYTN